VSAALLHPRCHRFQPVADLWTTSVSGASTGVACRNIQSIQDAFVLHTVTSGCDMTMPEAASRHTHPKHIPSGTDPASYAMHACMHAFSAPQLGNAKRQYGTNDSLQACFSPEHTPIVPLALMEDSLCTHVSFKSLTGLKDCGSWPSCSARSCNWGGRIASATSKHVGIL
jgi:hypothetical protein